MLLHLDIRDFAIVRHASLSLASGLTVLSGETGAGKSILIDAIGLLLGDRADSTQIRSGATQAELSAEWQLDGSPEAIAWLREQALLDDDTPDSLALRRVITADGRSRAFVNGRPAPIATLRELGEYLVEIHGQHAHQLLRKAAHQRRLLDNFAGHEDALAAVAAAAAEVRSLRQRIETLRGSASSDPQQVEFLRHQVNELDGLALSADELPELEQEHQRLAHAGELLHKGGGVLSVLSEDDQAVRNQLAQLAGVLADLQELAVEFSDAASLTEQARIAADEAAVSLRHALERIELDPERLRSVEDRLASIHDLARKHRVRPEALPQLLQDLQQQLDQAQAAGDDVETLARELEAAEGRYRSCCKPLHQARVTAGNALSKAVCAHLQQLSMADARLEVDVRSLDDNPVHAHGSDEVSLLFSANPGQPLQPLLRIASGGELSRVSLALQAALSAQASVPVMIFDEVDVGVGGATAEVVGQLLRALSARCQVLCVTHLPQVAAQGHQQINVRKRSVDGDTEVAAAPLDDAQRLEEVARMLGGVRITKQTRELASQMLAQHGAT